MSAEPLRPLLDEANELLAQRRVDQQRVVALELALDELGPRGLVRFDEQSRRHWSGIEWYRIPKLRGPLRGAGGRSLWRTLSLVSGDGHVREAGLREVPATRLHRKLLLLRCTDWVDAVRERALAQLDGVAGSDLLELLDLAEQLASERDRGPLLAALLDRKLGDDDLRFAARSANDLVRRAAWQRLVGRPTFGLADLEVAAADRDGRTRMLVVRRLGSLDPVDRRRFALRLRSDPIGAIASRSLSVLVDLDGRDAIIGGLTERRAAVRRTAQAWASIHGVDAATIYRAHHAESPSDRLPLLGLSDVGDAGDRPIFEQMLSDPRPRVVAAGISALARIDEPAGREAAILALQRTASGRVATAAADVLGRMAPNECESAVLARLVGDRRRPIGQRLRAHALMRHNKWLHIVVLLEAMSAEDELDARRQLEHELDVWLAEIATLGRRPGADLAERLDAALPQVDDRRRERIAFILRTSTAA